MPHRRPHADASASAAHNPHASDSPPLTGPCCVGAKSADFTEAAPVPTGAGHPLAGRSDFADAIGTTGEHAAQPNVRASSTVHLAGAINGRDGSPTPFPAPAPADAQAASDQPSALRPGRAQTVRTWPLLVLALPAVVAVWSGWVGIGQMTGFGQVHPLPGIWDSLHLNSAITLPVGVEAYAAYALRTWLSASTTLSARTRQFARASAIGSLLLGMAGQIAYHLLAQTGTTHAPWGITTAVSCLPVLVLGMGAALAHLLRADSCPADPRSQTDSTRPDQAAGGDTQTDHAAIRIRPERLAQARAAAASLNAAGKHVSRRSLRTVGVHGSNAELGTVARLIASQLANQGQ